MIQDALEDSGFSRVVGFGYGGAWSLGQGLCCQQT